VAELSAWRKDLRLDKDGSAIVGFVPTMGALHEGHMSLIRKARLECQFVVVSIFVNPLQFGISEDLSKYPRPFAKDLEFCRQAGVDLIFHPSVAEMYGGDETASTTVVPPPSLISILCAAFRPGHFIGVATVVLKLFNMVQANVAYFGEKDYQQLAVVKRMVQDLNVPIKIVGVPTGRDIDGLALSSRNVYLNEDERAMAPALYRTLCEVGNAARNDIPLQTALAKARSHIRQLADVELQYLEACDADTLETLVETTLPMVILVAAKFGSVRLIDNIIVRE
jgi:pantoate--beta-alanine ligase